MNPRPVLMKRNAMTRNARHTNTPTTGKIHQKPHIGPSHDPGPAGKLSNDEHR